MNVGLLGFLLVALSSGVCLLLANAQEIGSGLGWFGRKGNCEMALI